MLKALFRNRLFFGIFIFGLLVVMGCGLFYGRKVAKQASVKVYKPVEVKRASEPKPPPPGETAESGHWHGDEWHSEPHETEVSGVESQPQHPQPDAEGFTDIPPPIETPADFANPTSTSSNPLFADGVPEHLQCPPALIGVYMKTAPPLEIRETLLRIGAEVLEKYNPNRPLTEVYPAFIEAEKWYHANADPERAGIMSQGASRIDWQHQLMLDFPEIGVLVQEDPDRSFAMRRVELGHWSPDFNRGLINGRPFRTDADKQYVFTWSRYTETEDGFETGTGTYITGPSNGDPNAEVIEINMDEVSDEDLERLGGWNYNINPYTTGLYKLGDKQ